MIVRALVGVAVILPVITVKKIATITLSCNIWKNLKVSYNRVTILKAKMNEGGFNFAQTKDKSDLQRELQIDDDKEESAKFIKIKPQIN